MNWYKTAQRIKDLQDRTEINENIRQLESIASMLDYAAQLVYQTARGAKKVVGQIAGSKKMSSFDDLCAMLHEAEEVALDNPSKFGEICKAVSEQILRKTNGLRIDRKKFTDNLSNKGLVDK